MKIILATGASGGHIFPAVSVAKVLRGLGHEILFVTTPGPMSQKIIARGFSLQTVSSQGVSFSSLFRTFSSLWKMLVAFLESFGILRKFRPDCVAGFGGYGAFPVVLAACVLRMPTLIHEQNVFPGRANRILGQFVRKIAVTFSDGRKYFPGHKTVWTGYPQHLTVSLQSKDDLLKKFGLMPGRKTLLVAGGSQGSRSVNRVFVESIALLQKDLEFQVIHLTGEKDYEEIKADYKNSGISYCIFPFFDRMEETYHVADVLVARSGAGIVSEAAMFCLPAVFIPYPFAGGHQIANARVLADCSTAIILEEKSLTARQLCGAIVQMLGPSASKSAIAQKIKDVYIPDAANRLAKEIIELKK